MLVRVLINTMHKKRQEKGELVSTNGCAKEGLRLSMIALNKLLMAAILIRSEMVLFSMFGINI